LPYKRHFRRKTYDGVTGFCRQTAALAKALVPLEEKRQLILLQPDCAMPNKTDCPEYYETHKKTKDMLDDYISNIDKLNK